MALALLVLVLLAVGVSACSSGTRHHASTAGTFAPDNATTSTVTTVAAATTSTTLPPGPLAPVVYRVHTSAPVVFITIDDGVVRDPRVLALEQRLHVPMSLFLVSGPARAGRTYWQRMEAAGAAIEDHTLTHPYLTRLDYAAQQHEICGDDYELTGWFGKRPLLLRPPYGDYDTATRRAANACGLQAIVMWTATMQAGRFDVVGHVLRAGDIVILHFNETLSGDLSKLLAIIYASGFRVGRLEDSLTSADLTPTPAGPSSSLPT